MLTIEAVTALIPTVVNWNSARRRGGRVAEGGGLLNRYTGQNLYRGFESLPLRHELSSIIAVDYRLVFRPAGAIVFIPIYPNTRNGAGNRRISLRATIRACGEHGVEQLL
jgi:hypothetical protein